MYCVEVLLPVGPGDAMRGLLAALQEEFTDRFGGVTAFTRAPAEGRWDDGQQVVRDEIVVFEVMTPELDRAWWAELRRRLEADLNQDEIVVRAHLVETI